MQRFFQEHCIRCHGPAKQDGKLRLDQFQGRATPGTQEADQLRSVLERLEVGDMPPKKEPRPPAAAVDATMRWIREALAGKPAATAGNERDFPRKGNAVDHDLLFGAPSQAFPATDARIWRLNNYGYRELIDRLTQGTLKLNLRGREAPLIRPAFGLTTEPGFRDYAFRYTFSESEVEQMAANARKTIELMLGKPGTKKTPRELAAIAEATAAPSHFQMQAAVRFLFQEALCRQPTADELARYGRFLQDAIASLGNRTGLVHGLAPVLLHPEAVYRLELGQGSQDAQGRVRLAPLELAHALAYALTDKRPDALLLRAVQDGKLATAEDVRREAARLLTDAPSSQPRLLRFFREYFGYDAAPAVFKDDATIKAAGFVPAKYFPGRLVDDTDLLVLHVLAGDRQVLRELLTTTKTFNRYPIERKPVGKDDYPPAKLRRTPKANGLNGLRETQFHKHYSFDISRWSPEQPLDLPPNQRLGILTQPSWLIAQSDNFDNHAIHRGKWIREQLLGGYLPDTPITVDAQLPVEPHATLRHRMRVTRADYCWKCHEKMDPLGLPFEMFDHFGQYRTQEQGKPVDASGAVSDSGFRKHPARPAGPTIDCALAQALPAVIPHLGFGWDDLPRMHATPVDYAPSAWGAERPAPVYLDPELAFNNIFGIAGSSASRKEFEIEASLYRFLQEDVGRLHARLPEAEKAKYQPYLDSFVVNGERRKRLLDIADKLKKHAPQLTDKIRTPRHECDWFDATVDIAVAALVSGVTNVVTFSSGMCQANSGFWHGLNLKANGHGLGHTGPENPDWLILRRHNMQTLLRFVHALEAVPEGKGTMMDNTLIVYTSDNAESQHCKGERWPFLLIGNLGGTIRTGRYVHYPIAPKKGSRTINALYCSLLHAAGQPRDHFNLDGPRQALDAKGPLPELMN